MIKGTPELIAERREEIVNACEQLYQTMGFKEITLKEIGKIRLWVSRRLRSKKSEK